MAQEVQGIGVPYDTVERTTVAGTNSTQISASPGNAAGPIDPQTGAAGINTNVQNTFNNAAANNALYTKKRIKRLVLDLSVARNQQIFPVGGTSLFVAFPPT